MFFSKCKILIEYICIIFIAKRYFHIKIVIMIYTIMIYE